LTLFQNRAKISHCGITASIQESPANTRPTNLQCNDWIVYLENAKDFDHLLKVGRTSEVLQVARGSRRQTHLVKEPAKSILLSGIPYDFATKHELQTLYGQYKITSFKLLGDNSCYPKKTTDWVLSFRSEEEALTFELEQSGRVVGGRRTYASTL